MLHWINKKISTIYVSLTGTSGTDHFNSKLSRNITIHQLQKLWKSSLKQDVVFFVHLRIGGKLTCLYDRNSTILEGRQNYCFHCKLNRICEKSHILWAKVCINQLFTTRWWPIATCKRLLQNNDKKVIEEEITDLQK